MFVPAAVQATLCLAGVVPVFVHGLNRDAWLSSVAKVGPCEVLLIDDAVDQDRLAEIADWVLEEAAARLPHLPRQARE